MAYVAYNRGFKSGIYSTSSYNSSSTGALPPVEPEELNAYSIGFKSTFMDNRLRFNAEAFWYDYSNIQVQNNLPVGGGTRIVNGEEAYQNLVRFLFGDVRVDSRVHQSAAAGQGRSDDSLCDG